ncbi:flagellar export chaperone FliS [Oxalobacter sp. OttesenSCG-928-P03]|nr:flagellar export chaperone FliS [Oxalobacter sp. OttesenSCG-928-P03]
MFASSRHGVNAYARVGVETGVLAASPHKLIAMLYDGALSAINMAARHMETGDIEKKGEAIVKATTIIQSGLQASLNKEVGGELAQNLDALYDYMRRRLFEAHVKNDPEMLAEVKGLLVDIKSAWDEIGETVDKQPAAAPIGSADLPPPVSDPLAPRKTTLMRA